MTGNYRYLQKTNIVTMVKIFKSSILLLNTNNYLEGHKSNIIDQLPSLIQKITMSTRMTGYWVIRPKKVRTISYFRTFRVNDI